MPGRPLDRDDLLELFAELSAELHAEHTVDVIIAGGSFMALRQLRETTEDVDSVRRLAPRVRAAVARVAAARDLAPDWLNDHAVALAPHGLKATDIVFESATLAIRVPRHDDIFLMKLAAGPGAGPDRPDRTLAVLLVWFSRSGRHCIPRTHADGGRRPISRRLRVRDHRCRRALTAGGQSRLCVAAHRRVPSNVTPCRLILCTWCAPESWQLRRHGADMRF
ncbi:hypothetical protein BH18ACT3_BH18ACT3_18550 [soil metagenome]